ncbi:MAG: bifunctional 5,10-methylenetetrahydrofolate dehydrogenase/5,10-methenyltetrahydrofolate cyclohydrolase [Clostridiales Family XIII bacterium]|jgi:methylenetetrahydrofolate dehydrogenase (NADP+)/methenyltetrahydrofolate cyclohydrolase|nr:bifunctional 5,10-methylenetetrahydrofolate dehydrogenase/5,10-methenyltetrahydrofolate cyclohydrolase [Clostridiales Family XIII bacterium]
MAVFYTAKEVNAGIQKKIEQDLALLCEKGVLPVLATLRVGENGADVSYEIGATKRMKALGIGVRNVRVPADASQTQIADSLRELAEDGAVHGILLLQPLPQGIDEAAIKAIIPPEKDVDGATADNLGAVLANREECYPSCAPAAVIALLDHYGIEMKGKDAVIIGSGLLVGRPLAMLLAGRFATVTLCNVYSKDVPSIARRADVLVSAAGVAALVTEKYVREGQIVIDVGTTFKDGHLFGDVDVASVEPVVAAVTPTPGGVSGITTTILARNVVHAAKRRMDAGQS